MKTVIIKVEGDSVLKQLLDLVKKLKLKAKVMDTSEEPEKEHEEWLTFSRQNLAKAYGEDEPDYDLGMVKEINPEYKTSK